LGKIIEEFPFSETTMDMDGKLFSDHVDTIITLDRFLNAGIDYVQFDQAKLMACYGREAVKVGVIGDLKAQLDLVDNKEELLDMFVMNKMQLQDGRESSGMGQSLAKRLADLDDYLSKKKKQLDDPKYLEGLKGSIEEPLARVYKALGSLIRKIKVKQATGESNEEGGKQA